ncbi:hypothetical protein A9G05_04845 [Pseudomonas sp. ENNP23]|nr:hypothetical protein A9G05_04845 [Pseudomonas sp. ENNP23]
MILFLFRRAPHDRCRSGTRRHPPVRSTLSASNWLGGWLRHRLDNAWDAADLTQGTFVRVLAAHQQRTLPTLADLVASDPLVRSTNTSAGRFEQFSIRGCSLYNSDVAFGGLPTYSIDMEMVERVDVLKGPGALLGRLEPNGSVGGSINIEPKRSGADPVTEFTAMQASTGQLGGHVDIGRRFGEDQRYDKLATSPALGVVWHTTESLSLYANYMEGLTQGQTAPETANNAGQVFAPYRSKQVEAGIKYDMGNLTSALSVFRIEKPAYYTENGLLHPDGEPLEGVCILGGAMLLDAELTHTANGTNNGNRAVGVPILNANLGFEWELPQVQGLTLNARAIHTGA